MRTLTISDDFIRTSNLTDSDTGVAWDVSTATDISATVVSSDYKTLYCTATALNSGDSGSDWSNGVIVVSIPAATTAEIADHIDGKDTAVIAVQVTLGGVKTTVRDAVTVISGHIA